MSIGAPQRHDVNASDHTVTVMAGNVTLTLEDADEMHMDGGGSARDVTLPAEVMGAKVTIVNTGGETLTVKNDAAGTIGEVATAEVGVFYCDGTTWNHMTGVA